MKYLFGLLMLFAAWQGTAQSLKIQNQVLPEENRMQLKKNYKGATIVELSGVAIAFVGGSVSNDPGGRSAFVMFGSSLALGGLLFSLLNGDNSNPANARTHYRKVELDVIDNGVGVKMKF